MAFDAEPSKGVGSFKPPPVYVGAGGEYVRGAQGSYCYGGEGTTLCADYAYPLKLTARLPVIGGQRLTVDAGKRVKRLGAGLVRVEGDDMNFLRSVRARRAGKGRFWKLRLPADLGGADVLNLDLSFRTGGDSNVWAGLTTDGSTGARIPSEPGLYVNGLDGEPFKLEDWVRVPGGPSIRPIRTRTYVRVKATYTASEKQRAATCQAEHGRDPGLSATRTDRVSPLQRRPGKVQMAVQEMRRRGCHKTASEAETNPCGRGRGTLLGVWL